MRHDGQRPATIHFPDSRTSAGHDARESTVQWTMNIPRKYADKVRPLLADLLSDNELITGRRLEITVALMALIREKRKSKK